MLCFEAGLNIEISAEVCALSSAYMCQGVCVRGCKKSGETFLNFVAKAHFEYLLDISSDFVEIS